MHKLGKSKWLLISLLSFLFSQSTFALVDVNKSPIGYWTTISDEDNKPRSVVHITQRQGLLEGRIVKVYSKASDNEFCARCPGDFKDKSIIGLRFLWGLKSIGDNTWANGSILDPKKGKIYRCKISLEDSGKKLMVRGYIGISLFGRSQIWIRRKSD